MLKDILIRWGGEEVTALDVYKDMFKVGSGYLQKKDEPKGNYKANPIVYWKNNGKDHGHYRVMFEDDFEDVIAEAQQADFSIMNGITYFGRKNVQAHASKMFALIFDIDGVTDRTLNNLFNAAFVSDVYPIPNYVVLSGHGVHLYYLFDWPIPLFPNIKLQLKEFKYALTEKLWNKYTSNEKSKQKQGINQGFRVIGGKTKPDAGEKVARAFRMNSHPFSLEELGHYVESEFRVDENKLFRESKMTLEEAKQKFPEWYERVVLGKTTEIQRWKIEEKVHGKDPYALYNWWKQQIYSGATFGHRYFCIMCLAIYAAKCNVPGDQVEEDALKLVDFLNSLNPDEPFTEEDVFSALECYDLRYVTFPIRDLQVISNIEIKRNKRNGRNQEKHMRYMSTIRRFKADEGECVLGRPVGSGTKEYVVTKYFFLHPDASVTTAAKELGISRQTVYKYKGKVWSPLIAAEDTEADYKEMRTAQAWYSENLDKIMSED